MLPNGANLGLGCGNPTGIASLQPGESVLDLGSGAGVDCFIAANKVGPAGLAIGVDMTPEMVAKARENARKAGVPNVEFRLGELEHLPVEDRSVDVVVSNCVINLVPDKARVYQEAFRVLRPGGRLAIADMLATRPISDAARHDPHLWSGCSSGALTRDETIRALGAAGFADIDVSLLRPEGGEGPPGSVDNLGVVAATVRAIRPPEG
jgi:arsenite methyltransferase